VQGYRSNWPSTVNEFHEAYGCNEATVRLGPPSARHISEMDEALRWMMLLTFEPEYPQTDLVEGQWCALEADTEPFRIQPYQTASRLAERLAYHPQVVGAGIRV
jgi:Domain of unknown function (DUF6362)